MSAITQSARDQECTLRIVGYCNHNPETTVYAHFPDGTGGSNKLGGDLANGCHACSTCHDVLDGRINHDVTKYDLERYMRIAQRSTLRRLRDMKIIIVKGEK